MNLGQHDFEHLSDFCDCNWKRLVNSLTQKFGLKLTCGLVDDHQKDGVAELRYGHFNSRN